MTQIRYSVLTTLAAWLKLRREHGAVQDAEGHVPGGKVIGVPDSLRRDVGLPPAVEKPPPVVLSRIV